MLDRTRVLAAASLSLCACTASVAGTIDPPAGGGEDPGVTDPGGRPGEPQACEGDFENLTLAPVPPTVQLVVDMSGSMRERFGNASRWDAVRHALIDPTDGVVSRLESEVFFGATLYYSERGNGGGTCARLNTTSARLGNRDRIRTLIDAGNPHEDTPTAEAIDAVRTTLLAAAPESQRFIVLATDGNPDTCVDPDAHDLEAQILAENAVDRAHAAGITTLVLSVGSDITREHLRRIANLGAGEPVYTGNAPYYLATQADELVTELDALLTSTLPTCSYRVPGALAQANASSADLELDGDPLAFGVDWRWVDEQTVELLGAACDRALAAPATLRGWFYCDE